MPPRTRKTANKENETVSETTEVQNVAPDTAPYTDETQANPSHDVVEGSTDIEIPEGASRAHAAAIKRLNAARTRLTKLDARYAKAEREFREVEALMNSRRAGLEADVAGAQVDVDYHTNRKSAIDAALASAQARAAGHPEDAADNKATDSDTDDIDALDDAKGEPTNGGHVTFE